MALIGMLTTYNHENENVQKHFISVFRAYLDFLSDNLYIINKYTNRHTYLSNKYK